MAKNIIPHAIIDTLEQFDSQNLTTLDLPDLKLADYLTSLDFLKQYDGSKATFDSYRKEVERLIQWTWLIAKKSMLTLKRQDIEDYIKFCLKPPKSWIGVKRVSRFVTRNGKRVPNKDWRPFVATVTKTEHQQGLAPNKDNYQLSQKSIREIFTVLSSFYNYLLLEEKVSANPVALIRQKSKYLRKQQTQQPVPKLTELQWSYFIEAAEKMASNDPEKHERSLFMVTALYLMYLRISELVSSDRWEPQMGHFYQDGEANWWFKTVGKGNKERDISVSYDMLKALARYRAHRVLTPSLPLPGEETPLIHKLRGQGGLNSDRKVREIVQSCFDKAVFNMRQDGFTDEAESLMQATVHWLRHTGISDDINKRDRPIAHVRDDAGHSSSAITDRYNDIDRQERHRSAQSKKVKMDD